MLCQTIPGTTTFPEGGSVSTGIVFAIFQVCEQDKRKGKDFVDGLKIGQMAGALFIWVADWRGRRFHIFFGVIGVCIGTIVASTAKTLSIFIFGRFLLSFFATCAHTASPLLLVELAPPQYRASLAGMYNTLYYCVR